MPAETVLYALSAPPLIREIREEIPNSLAEPPQSLISQNLCVISDVRLMDDTESVRSRSRGSGFVRAPNSNDWRCSSNRSHDHCRFLSCLLSNLYFPP